MFGLPILTWVLIGFIAAMALSLIPASVWASLKPKASGQAILDNSKPVDTSNKYLAVQKMLLDARTACGECPEAITAIDAAIRATVAMVCKSKPNYSVTIANDWNTLGKDFLPTTYSAPATPAAPVAEVKQ